MHYIGAPPTIVNLFVIALCCLFCSHPARGGVLNWAAQFGSDGYDQAVDVAADSSGNVYVAAVITGNLVGPATGDAYIAKYTASGQLLWQAQIGDLNEDESTSGLFVDDTGVYLNVVEPGNLPTIQHYNVNGELQSTTPLGSLPPNHHQDVAWDRNRNFLLAGSYNDGIYVSKYMNAGALEWTRTLETTQFEFAASLAADSSGNVFVAGNTYGSLGGPNLGESDSFVGKYDPQGTLQWVVQTGSTEREWTGEIATDKLGNVYLAGATEGNVVGQNAGSRDAFVSKYDADGVHQWSCQIGGSKSDEAYGLTVDDLGNVFITGRTETGVPTQTTLGAAIFVSKLNVSGALLWTQQVEVPGGSFMGTGIDVNDLGNVFIVGTSGVGSLTANDPGEQDAFIARVNNPVPEPSSIILAAVGLLPLLLRRRSAC